MIRNEKAMTIIETIIALAILSIVLVVILDMFKFSFSLVNITERENLALYFAQEKIEEAKAKSNRGLDSRIEETKISINDSLEFTYKVETRILDLGLIELKVTVDYGRDKVVLTTRVGTYYAQ